MKVFKNIILIIILISVSSIKAQYKVNIYLLPGQGSDHRLYEKFDFPFHVNVKYNYLIENGSHMMTLTRGDEIFKIVKDVLKVKLKNE